MRLTPRKSNGKTKEKTKKKMDDDWKKHARWINEILPLELWFRILGCMSLGSIGSMLCTSIQIRELYFSSEKTKERYLLFCWLGTRMKLANFVHFLPTCSVSSSPKVRSIKKRACDLNENARLLNRKMMMMENDDESKRFDHPSNVVIINHLESGELSELTAVISDQVRQFKCDKHVIHLLGGNRTTRRKKNCETKPSDENHLSYWTTGDLIESLKKRRNQEKTDKVSTSPPPARTRRKNKNQRDLILPFHRLLILDPFSGGNCQKKTTALAEDDDQKNRLHYHHLLQTDRLMRKIYDGDSNLPFAGQLSVIIIMNRKDACIPFHRSFIPEWNLKQESVLLLSLLLANSNHIPHSSSTRTIAEKNKQKRAIPPIRNRNRIPFV